MNGFAELQGIFISVINTSNFNVLTHTVGSNGAQKFCIKKLGEPTSLPRAHTWYAA